MHRTFVWVAIATALMACQPVSTAQFDRLDAAGRGVRSAIENKAGLEGFRKAVDAFSAELATTAADASAGSDRARLDRYREIEASLKDIVLVWEEKNATQKELMALATPLASRLQKQYDLPVNTNEPPSIYASEAMQMIWDAQKKKMETLAEK